MKANLKQSLLALGATLALLTSAPLTFADAALNAPPATVPTKSTTSDQREYIGTLKAVDAEDHTVKVEKVLWNKTFNIADTCTFAIGLDKAASLEKLQPNMEVVVRYQETDGVLIASHIAQRWHAYTGEVKAVASGSKEVTLEKMGMARKFKLSEDARLLVHNKEITLKELKPGQRVTINYTKLDDQLWALKVVDPTDTMTGSLEAIDVASNTVKVKYLMTSRKFNLGDGCKVMVNDAEGKLKDLRIGQKVTIDYEEVRGVFVAARIELNNDGHEPVVAATRLE